MKQMLNKLNKANTLARKEQKEVKGGVFVEANPCNPGDFACMDVYLPVLCSDGNIYSNGCYAALNCQYNCVRWDGDLA
jgi:hypothetical protein